MIRNVLEGIQGVEGLPVFVLSLFMMMFVGITIMAMTMRKSHVTHMGNLPLEDDQPVTSQGES